jgi:DNA repair and recombination protein RAD54B
MARIHRHGQKKPVKIYRLLTAGGMDEKIFQRQVTKRGLADSVVDGQKNEASFSAEELQDLFRLDLKANCQTHDLLGCDCNGLGNKALSPHRFDDTDHIDALGDVGHDDSSDDSDFALLSAPPLVPATTANVVAIEERIRQRRAKRSKNSKGEMQALMQYAHLDTTVLMGDTKDVFGYEIEEVGSIREKLGDEVLVEALKDERCKVSFVFTKEG